MVYVLLSAFTSKYNHARGFYTLYMGQGIQEWIR